MNPSPPWNNPPPPGIDLDEEEEVYKPSTVSCKSAPQVDHDPYIKNPEYIKYKSLSKERTYQRRSRSRSHERYKSKKRNRSRSRNTRHRRSRSRSKERRRKQRSSSSSSRSRSPSHEKISRHKSKHYSSRSRKYTRSRSRSRDATRHRRSRDIKYRKSHTHSPYENDEFIDPENIKREEEEEDIEDQSKENAYKNDGSFLEMFKKLQEAKVKTEANEASSSEPKKLLPTFGKRRGGRVLKTGMVEKTKLNDDDDDTGTAQDPWSIYLKEVRKYKEACCDDDSKTRPLVK